MMAVDADALYCDLAETYHIFGFDSLPAEQVAILASGLREDSRIMQKIMHISFPPLPLMLARLTDEVSLFRAGFAKKPYQPTLFMDGIMEKKQKVKKFASGDAWRKEWNRINNS